METIHIYTDGACSGNPGPGGAAAVVVPEHGDTIRRYKGYRHTTNNRMELMGIILALDTVVKETPVQPGDVITIHTDSQIAYGGLALGWKRKANTDLWEVIDRKAATLKKKTGATLRFEKVEGHAGHQWNELADRLAVLACTTSTMLPDEGYTTPTPPTVAPEPGLFDEAASDDDSITADDVSQFLAREAREGGCTYELLANMFASNELSLERLAAELTKHMS